MGGIVRRRKQRKRGNKNKVTDYSPEMLEMLARRRKYDEWRGEEIDRVCTEEERNRQNTLSESKIHIGRL